jgi:hypothetical protein
MVSLSTQQQLRAAQDLPFCYLCGVDFKRGDHTNRDHVPPKSVFSLLDRQPLILRTHRNCNQLHSLKDEKIGQLIALKQGRIPFDPRNRRLHFTPTGLIGATALINLSMPQYGDGFRDFTQLSIRIRH